MDIPDDTSTPHSSYVVCILPPNENDVNHYIFSEPSAVTMESFSSNQNIRSNIANVNNTIAFEYRQPAGAAQCMMSVTIDLNIWKAIQASASMPITSYTISAFQAKNIDFSDEGPVGPFIGSDRFTLVMSVNDDAILTNRQTCRLCILLQEMVQIFFLITFDSRYPVINHLQIKQLFGSMK